MTCTRLSVYSPSHNLHLDYNDKVDLLSSVCNEWTMLGVVKKRERMNKVTFFLLTH